MEFVIAEYLESTGRARGTCKVCGKLVAWSRDKLAAHKRANCIGIPEAQKEIFRPRKNLPSPTQNLNNSDVSMHSVDNDEPSTSFVLTEEKKSEIDAALAKLFFRTGIPFKVVDSEAFREFVALLNPAYSEVMPKSYTVSGRLLEKEYTSSFNKLTEIVGDSTDLTLITDGWTNVRGDHIVNFMVKAPGKQSMFYKSLDTTGIIQDTNGVTSTIRAVIEEIGPEKVSAAVTDNAPVMKASWEELEKIFPNLSAFGCAAHGMNLLVKDILVPHKDGKIKFPEMLSSC